LQTWYRNKDQGSNLHFENTGNTWVILWLVTLWHWPTTMSQVYFFFLFHNIFCFFVHVWHCGWPMSPMSPTTMSPKYFPRDKCVATTLLGNNIFKHLSCTNLCEVSVALLLERLNLCLMSGNLDKPSSSLFYVYVQIRKCFKFLIFSKTMEVTHIK